MPHTPESIQDFLGDESQKVTHENLSRIIAAFQRIDERYPNASRSDTELARQRAYWGAFETIVSTTTLDTFADEYRTRRRKSEEAHDSLTGSMIASSVLGLNEAHIVAITKVSRPTARKAIGK